MSELMYLCVDGKLRRLPQQKDSGEYVNNCTPEEGGFLKLHGLRPTVFNVSSLRIFGRVMIPEPMILQVESAINILDNNRASPEEILKLEKALKKTIEVQSLTTKKMVLLKELEQSIKYRIAKMKNFEVTQ